MDTSVIAFFNKRGIVCASDLNMSIFAIHKTDPVVIAVNAKSPIPWNELVQDYLQQPTLASHKQLSGYFYDFEGFLKKQNLDIDVSRLSKNESAFLGMGFGTDDIFPTIMEANLSIDPEAKIKMAATYIKVDRYSNCGYRYLGRMLELSAMLNGITSNKMDVIVSKQEELFDAYKRDLLKVVSNTPYKECVDKYFSNFDISGYFKESMVNISNRGGRKSINGVIGGLNIEDLVSWAEEFTNARGLLRKLKSISEEHVGQTKELMALTRTEGLTWIKHSLFGL